MLVNKLLAAYAPRLLHSGACGTGRGYVGPTGPCEVFCSMSFIGFALFIDNAGEQIGSKA